MTDSPPSTRMHVIVVGAGWAGLTCAIHLAAQNVRVSLFEASKFPGGRARLVTVHDTELDNGQHLLLGAYRQLLRLIELVGIREQDVLLRQPLELEYWSPVADPVCLNVPALPAPLHLAVALLTLKGLPVNLRWQALRLSSKMAIGRFHINQDENLLGYLQRNHQSSRLIEALWEPLCLSALNTPIGQASTRVFLRVLRDAFLFRRADSDTLIPHPHLSALLPEPATAFIENHGGQVNCSKRVTGLRRVNGKISGVTVAGDTLNADHVVLAVPPRACLRLIEKVENLDSLRAQLNVFTYQPICTVYLQYPEHVQLGKLFRGILHSTAQWVFDRQLNGQPGLMAVIISGPGQHMRLEKEALVKTVASELAQMNPEWPEHLSSTVICEKHATFSCDVDIDQHRPGNRTNFNNLWLAADYTDTGYPATLEGAAISGQRCAELIIK